MKTKLITFAAMLLATAIGYADKEPDYSQLPPRVQQTIREYKGDGEVKRVLTKRLDNGQVAYEVDYKHKGDEKQILIGQDGFVIGDERYVGKGKKDKDKDEKKGKDKDKDKDKGRDSEVTRVPPPVTPVPAPVPVPGSSATNVPARRAERAERRADNAFQRQVRAIYELDSNVKAMEAGLRVISRETGVATKVLAEQRERHKVGAAGLLLANELAQLTKKPAREMFALHTPNSGWEEVAEKSGVNPQTLVPTLQKLHRAMSSAVEK